MKLRVIRIGDRFSILQYRGPTPLGDLQHKHAVSSIVYG